MLGPLLEVEMSKKRAPLWVKKHISKSKCTKHTSSRSTFGSWHVEKVHAVRTPLWREAHVEAKSVKNWRSRTTFRRSDVVLRCRRKGFCTLPKVIKPWGFCSISKNDRRRGTFEEDLERCISRGRRDTKEMLGGQGADFLRGVAFWSIKSSGLLRWFCVTGVALRMTWHHFFVAGAALYTDGVEKIAKRNGTRPSALHSSFHFWGKSHRIASFLMLSTWKIEVSQNSFVFAVVTFKIWGSLEELLRLWCCQVRKLRKSRRIASFSNLQIDTLMDGWMDGRIDRQLQLHLQLQPTLPLQLQMQMQIQICYATVH